MQLIAKPRKGRRRFRRAERETRGVALIFVLTTVAILTAIGVDFAYNSRVNFELAVQSRDSLRARSLAMSGMNMARFLLYFQGQLDQITSNPMASQIMNAILAMLPGIDPTPLERMCLTAGIPPSYCLSALSAHYQAPAGPNGAAAAAQQSGGTVIQLWRIADKFNSTTIFNFLNSFPTPADKKVAPTSRSSSSTGATPIEANFGEFTGTFDMKLTDEDQKINIQRLGGTVGTLPLMTVIQLKGLVDNPKYDFIFNEEDTNHDKVARNDVFTSLFDWVDPTQQGHAFDPNMTTGTPFVPGAGDKNGPYSRYKPRYKSKNARFDSIDEARMVYGISDNFMLAFGDRLTVYSNINGKINVNTDSPEQLWADILSLARNPLDPALQNPFLPQIIMMELQMRRHYLPFIGVTYPDFLAILQAMHIDLSPNAIAGATGVPVPGATGTTPAATTAATTTTTGATGGAAPGSSMTASTFRIVSTGIVGRVKKTLTAVLQYDQGMGQLMYWHED
jgi:general secretion pathway protein K